MRRYFIQSTGVYEDLPVNLFAAAAARQSLSESALLKRLVEQMLASAEIDDIATEPVAPLDPRDARLTVRLVPEDRALLRERERQEERAR